MSRPTFLWVRDSSATYRSRTGGPVFFTKRAAEPWCFAGVLITSALPARVARFIDARKVVDTLRWHYDANPTATIDARKRRPW